MTMKRELMNGAWYNHKEILFTQAQLYKNVLFNVPKMLEQKNMENL